MFGVLKQVLLLLLVSVRTALHLPWLRFNRWLHAVCRALLRKSEVPRRRVRVLLVGDGLAEGVGDWVTVGHRAGVQARLERGVQALPGVRVPVDVGVVGHVGSTSAEWLPDARRAPAMKGCRRQTAPLFKTHLAPLLHDPARRPHVVIIMLGSMDGARHATPPLAGSARGTADNVEALTRALLDAGVSTVCVCLAPPSAPDAAPRNTATIAATIKLQAEFSKDRVVLAPSFGRDPALFAFDGAHLSSKGYTAFTPLLLKSLQSSLATASGKVLAEAVATAAT